MELVTQERTILGKAVHAMRKAGLIPAEFYSRGMENKHLAISAKAFRSVFQKAGENTVIELVIDGKKQPVLVADVMRDSMTDEIIHVDFHGIRMDEKITTRVPLEFVDESPAVKEKDGVLNISMNDLEVESLPADIPHSLVISLRALTDLNQSIYVKDIAIPKGVRVMVDLETVIATVTEKKEEEVVVAPVDVSAVKVESEEKKAERDAERAAESAE